MASPFEQGAFPVDGGVEFRVWAPYTQGLDVELVGRGRFPMARAEDGMFSTTVRGAGQGDRYQYVFPDGRRRADPASRKQDGSVHGVSTVADLEHRWTDSDWRGLLLEDLVTYELHVGTFTPEGTLDAVIPRLEAIRDLGCTAVEIMPVAAWDGPRGWGYDGVLPYAVHAAYGGPKALQRLADACHAAGLALILDVVYNHLGPAGNYLREFGPYFTSRHQTPWGEAIDFDGPRSRAVREFFIQNALAWVRDFHVDGLRLDAIHGIVDESPVHVVRELAERVEDLSAQLGRRVHVIAESDLNDPKVIRPRELGGWGCAAQWSDDFHHALHVLLTGETGGYYADFQGVEDLAEAYRDGFVVAGKPSRFRGRVHGEKPSGLPGRRFVVAAQNHDQIGNRALGDRLAARLPPEALRAAAAATLLSPFSPLLFMGEEYAEKAPFQYFTSFPDQELGRSVSEGRRREFASFAWAGEVPDPQAESTFARSRIDWSLRDEEPGLSLRRFYRAALDLRRRMPVLRHDRLEDLTAKPLDARTLLVVRRGDGPEVLLLLRFADEPGKALLPPGRWRVLLDSWARQFAAIPIHREPETSGETELGPWHALLLERAG